MKIIYDSIDCELRSLSESLYKGESFDWKNYKNDDPASYFKFEKWVVRDVIKWCDDLELSYKIIDHKWAMQLIFDFKHDEEAVWFILRWMNSKVIDRVSTTNNEKWIL